MLSAVTVVCSSLALQEEWGEESWETCRQVQACSLMPVIAPFAFCGADRQWQTRLKLPQPYYSMPATRLNPLLFHSVAC